MDTLMDQSAYDINDVPIECTRADVQLVPGGIASLPCFGYGDMSVGFGRALNRDDRLLQLPAEIFGVYSSENLLMCDKEVIEV